MRQPGDERVQGVAERHYHDDGYQRCRMPDGLSSEAVGDDNIHFQIDQFDCEFVEPVASSLSIAKFDVEVPTFDVAKVAKTGPKFVAIRRFFGG
jgi:hypothetical protein